MRKNIYIEKRKVSFLNSLTNWVVLMVRCVCTLIFLLFLYLAYTCTAPLSLQASEVKKCERYKHTIVKEISKYNNSKITSELVCAVMSIESSFRTKVESHYGAIGLMQITTHVLDDYNKHSGKKMKWEQVYKVKNNILLGVWYLHRTHRQTKKYSGADAIASALSAYYWGLSRAVRMGLIHTEYSQKVLAKNVYFMSAFQPKIKKYNYRRVSQGDL